MSIVIDLILIAIILLFALISAKRGFVKVLVETVGFVAAIILAFTISTPLATTTYDKLIEPPVVEAAVNAVGESAEHEAWNALPDFLMNNSLFGEEINSFTEKISQNISAGTETAVKNASQEIIKPVAVKIIGLVFSVILVIILLIAVKFLAKVINKLFSFSVVGKLNRTLGGVVGLVKGFAVAVLVCLAVSLIRTFAGDFLIFTTESVNNSVLFKFVLDTFNIL